MHTIRYTLTWLVVLLIAQAAFSQPKRIRYNNQDLFLNGANLAWAHFANDIGPGTTDTARFMDVMLSMHDKGGNAMRWWLHTDGTYTPEYDESGYVIGPGTGTIADLKKVLDLAWEREIGVDLCLWSFDMLRSNMGSTILNRNTLLLNDTNYTRAYINTCLIPMVEALKGHPAILTWEIFNEPEGMSDEFGWGDVNHVPMSSIQRFVNMCTGAIHRTDTTVLVTNGAWSFYALSDNPLAKSSIRLSKFNSAEKLQIGTALKQKYRSSLTTDEIINHLEKIAATEALHQNYYRDDRLLAAGGDPDGMLDFYSVHYYSTSTGISTSPFNNPAGSYGLSKPIVVGELATDGRGKPSTSSIYDTLFQLGYAGALAWSFTDPNFSSAASMLAEMQSMWNNHRTDVDVKGIAPDWPTVTISSPPNNAQYPDSTQITIKVMVLDTLPVNLVEFLIADTQKIGSTAIPDFVSSDTSYYTFVWKDIPAGQYTLKVVATNSYGHQGVSVGIIFSLGMPPMTKLEAEKATRAGQRTKMINGYSTGASGGMYVDVKTYEKDGVSSITWEIPNVPTAGSYPISIGYNLNYDHPKNQFININGVRSDTAWLDGPMMSWLAKTMYVNLIQGSNTIQMEMWMGWIYLDYLAVPTNIVTSVAQSQEIPSNYSLDQNYPNPFNPSTTIRYSLPHAGYVKLFVYDILGRQVAALVNKTQDAGTYNIPFDASLLPSGVYFYRLNAGTYIETKKLMLLK
jgi:hypothetical protein